MSPAHIRDDFELDDTSRVLMCAMSRLGLSVRVFQRLSKLAKVYSYTPRPTTSFPPCGDGAPGYCTFQEACAISAAITLATFEPGKAAHLTISTHMTPVCDCIGFTRMPILPDAGVFGSDDIVAIRPRSTR